MENGGVLSKDAAPAAAGEWRMQGESPVLPMLEIGPVRLDFRTFEVVSNGTRLTLTRIEFDILAYLMQNAHRVVSQQELVRRVTGGVYTAESSLIRVHVSRLRRKLGGDAGLIETVRGRGFRFGACTG